METANWGGGGSVDRVRVTRPPTPFHHELFSSRRRSINRQESDQPERGGGYVKHVLGFGVWGEGGGGIG